MIDAQTYIDWPWTTTNGYTNTATITTTTGPYYDVLTQGISYSPSSEFRISKIKKASFGKDGKTCNITVMTDFGEIKLVMDSDTLDNLFTMLDCKMKDPGDEALEKLFDV